jgi:hypothetical protein
MRLLFRSQQSYNPMHQMQNYFCLPDSSFPSSFFQKVLDIALLSCTYTILVSETYIIWNWHKFFLPIGRSWRKKKLASKKVTEKEDWAQREVGENDVPLVKRSLLNFNLTALQSILPPRCSIPSSWASSRHHCHFSISTPCVAKP